MNGNILISNIDKLHTTSLGEIRIRKNLKIDLYDDVVMWCKNLITDKNSIVKKEGKNWYITLNKDIIVVNASSYTIITAHKLKYN